MITRLTAWLVAVLAVSINGLAFAHSDEAVKVKATRAVCETKAATAIHREEISASAKAATNGRVIYEKSGVDMVEHGGGLNKCGCHFDHKTGDCRIE